MTLITSPLQYHRLHGQHHGPMCEFVCLPQFLLDEFIKKSGQGDNGYQFVTAWAESVKAKWTGKDIAADDLTFWRARWAERGKTGPLTRYAQSWLDEQHTELQQAIDTRRRRAEMLAQGMDPQAVEDVFDHEYTERLAQREKA